MSSHLKDSVNKHLGYAFLDCMIKCPNDICQIDAATGESETNASVLSRSIRLARCLRNYGLQPGDVLSLGGRNHLDLHIPLYAALLNGLPVSGVDPAFKYDEIKSLFKLSEPKIAFCDKETHEVYKAVIKDLGLATEVVTFGEGETSMNRFVEKHDTNESVQDYVPTEIDLDKTYAFLISSSGTSGKIKLAAIKHENMINKLNTYIKMTTINKSGVYQIYLALSPINWISGFFSAIGLPMMRQTKLQTSNPDDFDHIIDMINKYKPVSTLLSPSFMLSLMNRKEKVDLSCFRILTFTGAKIKPEAKAQFRALVHKDTILMEVYGMTETLGPCLSPNTNEPIGSCGRRTTFYSIKLVDPDSGKEITQPNTLGEFWVKGIMFSEYYNDPEGTSETFTEDGYYKTGDLLYFDENENFYYVDRLKDVIKFRGYQMMPAELEEIIHKHPAVRDVYVCGVPDPNDGQRPVACVVVRDGCTVGAQEIKDLIAEKLSKNKQLTGGVVFLDELPMTSTGKVSRAKLLKIISEYPKQ